MKKIDLGQTIQLLANFGVLLGILLLVYELNQNRQMMQSQTRSDISEGITDYLVNIGSDPALMDVVARGNTGGELVGIENAQYSILLTGLLRYFENVHYQYRNGLYDEVEFETQKDQWRILFAQKGYADFWCGSEISFSPEFAAEIDGVLSTYQCE